MEVIWDRRSDRMVAEVRIISWEWWREAANNAAKCWGRSEGGNQRATYAWRTDIGGYTD